MSPIWNSSFRANSDTSAPGPSVAVVVAARCAPDTIHALGRAIGPGDTRGRRGVRRHSGVLVAALAAAWTICGFAGQGAAQGLQAALDALVAGAQNPQQESIARHIGRICPDLATAPVGSLNAAQDDLRRRCTGTLFPAAGQDQGTTLQNMAAEELISQEAVVNGTIEPQTRALTARLSALGGRSRGGQVANLYPRDPGNGLLLASADPIQVVDQGSGMSASFPNGLGIFLNGSYNFGNRDATALESGFDFDDYSLTGGVDYFVLDNLVVGIAGGYAHTDIEIDSGGGDVDGDGYNVALYSLWNPMDQLGISAYVSYGMVDYSSQRNLNFSDGDLSATPTPIQNQLSSDTDADQFEATGNVYYDFTQGPWTFGPTLQLSFVRFDIDGFTENGGSGAGQGLGLTFDDQEAESLQTALGGAVSHAIGADFGVVLLQARAEWVHEYLDDSRIVTGRFANAISPVNPPLVGSSSSFSLKTDDPDRDRFRVGAGASAVLQGGISAFADFETVLGHEDVESYTATAGVRMEF